MDTPESMKEELGRWNNGAGIDLDAWASCMGNYGLAVGYLTVEVMLESRENPLISAFRPHFAQFMKDLKSGSGKT